MRNKPFPIYFVTIALFLTALSFPIQAAFLYGHSLSELPAAFSKISFLNWLTISCLLATSFCVYQASSFLKVLAPLSLFMVGLNNYVVGSYALDYSFTTTVYASLAYVFLLTPLMHKSCRTIIANPGLRWWNPATRHRKNVSAVLNPFVGNTIHAETFDISDSGAFVKFSAGESPNAPKVGDKIRISITISSMHKIRCDAKVVRVAPARGTYPEGLGLEFISLEKSNRRDLQHFLRSKTEMTA